MNNLAKANFWKEFICTKCDIPNIENLYNHFENAHFSEFCECGCNSFKIEVNKEKVIKPLAKQHANERAIFESYYLFKDQERSLEIIIFADKEGYLSYINVDCCANTFPVPETIDIIDKPFYRSVSNDLIL